MLGRLFPFLLYIAPSSKCSPPLFFANFLDFSKGPLIIIWECRERESVSVLANSSTSFCLTLFPMVGTTSSVVGASSFFSTGEVLLHLLGLYHFALYEFSCPLPYKILKDYQNSTFPGTSLGHLWTLESFPGRIFICPTRFISHSHYLLLFRPFWAMRFLSPRILRKRCCFYLSNIYGLAYMNSLYDCDAHNIISNIRSSRSVWH